VKVSGHGSRRSRVSADLARLSSSHDERRERRRASNPPNGSEIVVSAFASPGCARRDVLTYAITLRERIDSPRACALFPLVCLAGSEIPQCRSLPGTRSSSPLFRPDKTLDERPCVRYVLVCAFPSNRISQPIHLRVRSSRESPPRRSPTAIFIAGVRYPRMISREFARPQFPYFRYSSRRSSAVEVAALALNHVFRRSRSRGRRKRLDSRGPSRTLRALSIFIAIIARRISDAHLRNKCLRIIARFESPSASSDDGNAAYCVRVGR